MIVKQQIRAARILLEMDQKSLAKVSGVGITTIQRLEKHGTKRSKVVSVHKVADVLEGLGIEFMPADKKKGFGVRRRF